MLLINSGNRDILLKDVSYKTGTNKEEAFTGYEIKCPEERTVINPDKIELINIEINQQNIKEGNDSEYKLFICFNVISASGKYHEFYHDISNINGSIHNKEMWKLNEIKKFRD